MKETHQNMDHLLSAINYQEEKCWICGDLKVDGLVLGSKKGILVFCVFGTVGQTKNTMSDKSGR